MTFEQAWMVFVGAVITAAVGAFSSYVKEIRIKHEKESSEKEKTIELLKVQNEELRKWRVNTEERMADIVSDFHLINKHMDNMTAGCMAMLKNQIVQSCKAFCKIGHINMTDRDNIRAMYKWYAALGGNGAGEYWYHKAMEIPVDDTPSVPVVDVDLDDEKRYMNEIKHELA